MRAFPMARASTPSSRPCAIDGPSITIRKFGNGKLGIDDLVKFGSLTQVVAEFLKACVVGRLNIVVAGGTGSGKTTLAERTFQLHPR